MQGASLDIVCAYRNLALLPNHKPYRASMWKDLIYVDHCALEGLSSVGNTQGAPVDALVAILHHHGIPNILKLVDNFCIFCSPSNSSYYNDNQLIYHYPFNLKSIHDIMDPLRVLWHPITIKGQDFASTIPHMGFMWDLSNWTVSLSEKKCLKYLNKVLAFQLLACAKFSHKNCLSIHGTLQHITFIYRHACSSLPPISAFITKFPNDYAHHHVPHSVHKSLAWWIAVLHKPSASQSLFLHHAINPSLWVDASTSWGIGIVFGCEWAGWHLSDNGKGGRRDIGWAKAIALKMAIL